MARLSGHRKRPLLAATWGAVVFTLGCTAGSRWLGRPEPTATPPVLADCFWAADVAAWVDANGNGARDEGEPPLEGVQVNLSLSFMGSRTTGADGRVHVGGMHPGECLTTEPYNVMVATPDGYEPTTATTLPYTEAQDLYEFGFKASGD